jgi:O-antigen chain-terminating methyltransferase
MIMEKDKHEDHETESFYRAFEDRYRGSRDLIKGRLRVYLPFVEALKTLYSQGSAIDLGCGRGEWLELLVEQDIDALGVDLDDGMLEVCRELGLSHSKQDAITYLKGLPDESQVIVSGFHLAEHLPFAELQTLVREALRVLQPAGLLILETPNPENFSVGTNNFYIDPTHQRPIPPQLLSFLPEHYGYCRTKVLRLQESPELVMNQSPALLSLLNGVSPDYAIVSQKGAEPEELALFDDLFARDYGLSIETLAMRYESNINQNFIQSLQFAQRAAEQTETKLQASQQRIVQVEEQLVNARINAVQVESALAELRTHAQWLENEWNAAKVKVDELNQNCHHWWTIADGLDRELKSVYGSRSWRYTKPLREFGHILRRWCAAVFSVPGVMEQGTRALIKPVLAQGVRFVMVRPALKAKALNRLRKHPEIEARLRRFAAARGLTAGFGLYPLPPSGINSQSDSGDLAHLTPRARQIYLELKAAIEKNRETH